MEENKKLNYSLQSPKERSKFVQEFINAADKNDEIQKLKEDVNKSMTSILEKDATFKQYYQKMQKEIKAASNATASGAPTSSAASASTSPTVSAAPASASPAVSAAPASASPAAN